MYKYRYSYIAVLLIAISMLFGAFGSCQAQFDEEMFFKEKKKRKLIVGIKKESPFIMEDTDGTYYGLSIDLWEHLAKEIDVDYEYKSLRSTYGIVTSLHRQQIDISISPLTATATRISAFDVSQPFFVSSLGVAISTEHGDSIIWNLFSLGIVRIVASLVLVIACIGTAIWLLERRRNSLEFSADPKEGWVDGIWWAAVTMTTVGYGDKIPKTRSGKLLGLAWMFTSIILISSLTASITSQLSKNQNSLEIKRVEDLENIKNQVGTVAHSSSADYLNTHKINLQPQYCFDDPLDGLKALQTGEIRVFVYDKPIMYYLLTQHGLKESIKIMPVTFNENYCCFMMPKGNGLLKELNPELVDKISISSWISTLRKYNLGENSAN